MQIVTKTSSKKYWGESHFYLCHIIIFKMSIFNKKLSVRQEIRKHGPHTGKKKKKKASNRNCLGGNTDMRLTAVHELKETKGTVSRKAKGTI